MYRGDNGDGPVEFSFFITVGCVLVGGDGSKMANILVYLTYPPRRGRGCTHCAGGVVKRGVIPQTATIGTF